MRDQDKNRDPERAQKRALADGRTAWRKMSADQRAEFVRFMVEHLKEERGNRGYAGGHDHGLEGSGLRVWFGFKELSK